MSSEDSFNGSPRRLLSDFLLLSAHYRLRSGTRQRANNSLVRPVPGYSTVTLRCCPRARKGILVRNTCAANLCKTQMVTGCQSPSSGVTRAAFATNMHLVFIDIQGIRSARLKGGGKDRGKQFARGFYVSTAFSTVFGVAPTSPGRAISLHNSFIFQRIWLYYLKVTRTRFRRGSDGVRTAEHANGKQQDCT